METNVSKLLLVACLALVNWPALAQSAAAVPPQVVVAPRHPTDAAGANAVTTAHASAAAAAGSVTGDAADAALHDKAVALAAQLDRLLAMSRSPRDQALRWDVGRWAPGTGTGAPTGRASLHDAAAHAPSDRLVQWLWARASPAESGCPGARACPGRAQALAKLEPGNGAAWMPVLEQAWDAEDDAAIEAALSRMAQAASFDDLFAEYAGAWAEVENRFPAYVAGRSAALSGSGSPVSSEVSSIEVAIARSSASAIPNMGTLVDVCDRGKHPEASAARFDRCGAIGRLMLGKGTTVLSRSVGVAVLRRSGQLTVQDRLANRSLRWSIQQSADLHLDEKDPEGFRRYFADLVQSGSELAAMERQVARAGKAASPPAGWKAPDEE